MKGKGQVELNSKVFEYLGIISFVCAMYVFVFAELIYRFLFTGDYVGGYIVSPYLFLAPMLQMLFQVACNQFLVIKKTWPNLLILSGGAVMNVFLNLFLIPKIGIEGAAIATLVGYGISDIVAVIVLQKMKLMVITRRFMVSAVLMGGFILMWRLAIKDQVLLSLAAAAAMTGMFLRLYRKDLERVIEAIKK